MSERKYLNIGSLVEFETKNGPLQKLQIDNEKLDELIALLDGYFQKRVEGLSVDDIRAAQKLKWDDPNQLKRVEIVLFDPNENAPDFIKKNLSIKIADYV